ncbi:MAG: hypothetical protein V4502_05420 [Pseudomonadota bacterium]
MLDRAEGRASARQDLWILLGILLAVSVAKLLWNLPQLREWVFPDPDDAMRLLQVRDWLAGQSWFDVTQYRLNPPFGAPMHWSRLVDLPLAAVILLTRPLLGSHGAEMAALIAVPTITLGLAMLLIYRIAALLGEGRAALLAAAVAPVSLGGLTQMRLMRIDHHGWQIVLALAAVLAVLDSRPRRSALLAGAAVAVWLNISLEALPLAAAIGAWFAFNWLFNPLATERLRTYTASLAGFSALLFAGTHAPSAWTSLPHDALNIAHLAAFAAAALCCQLAVRASITKWRFRLYVLAVAGLSSAAAMFGVDPHSLQAPFASLDPIVHQIWYDGVREGQPVWRLPLRDAAAALAQPLVGLIGGCVAIWTCPADRRPGWQAYTFLLAASTLTSVSVVREATSASMLSLPGTAYLCAMALRRARGVSLMPARVVATVGALLVMAPAYAVPTAVAPGSNEGKAAARSNDACVQSSEVAKLNALPPSILAVPLDITPAILVATAHKAVGSGHHRNVSGIRDMILLFVRTPDKASEILQRRHIDYVVFCPRTSETLWWAANGPNGLAAMLNDNKAPDWLEPARVPGLRALQVWRVRKERLAALKS